MSIAASLGITLICSPLPFMGEGLGERVLHAPPNSPLAPYPPAPPGPALAGRPPLPTAPARGRSGARGAGRGRYAAVAFRRPRRCMALPGDARRGLTLLPGSPADLRGPLVSPAPRHQPAGARPCGLAEPHRRARGVRRQYAVDAGGAAARSARAQSAGQAQAAVADRAAGVAPVQG